MVTFTVNVIMKKQCQNFHESDSLNCRKHSVAHLEDHPAAPLCLQITVHFPVHISVIIHTVHAKADICELPMKRN